jgi:methyl-accepting chemotaxis protein
MNKELDKVLSAAEQINADVQNITKKSVATALFYIGLIVGIGILVSFAVVFLFINDITKPLSRLQTIVLDVEKYADFSTRVNAVKDDEVGKTARAFGHLISVLHEAISDINRGMTSVSKGDFSNSLTKEQASNLEQLKDSVNEFIKLLGQSIAKIIEISENVKTKSEELSGSTPPRFCLITQMSSRHPLKRSTRGIIKWRLW